MGEKNERTEQEKFDNCIQCRAHLHSTALEVHPFLYNHIRNVRQRDTGHNLDTLFFM